MAEKFKFTYLEYIREVTSGKVPVCKMVKLAVKRHVADLKKSKAGTFPYYFDQKKAQSAIIFFSLLVHTKGKLAGQKLKPESWQQFIIAMIYGWRRVDNNKRRFRKAYIQDGIVQTRFFKWLEEQVSSGTRITESDASDRLHELRASMPDFLDESFETISAYGKNAALPHYSTVRGKDAVLEPHGLYLNDSGAHYRYGTTDITRTVPLGPVTDLEREDYTLDMMAMIDLAMAFFPEGTPGCRIDAIARRPLWNAMRNFGHGTGHGVGNVLSVHEGPQSIRQNLKNQPMLPGMITSDEPGIYREGYHGIRHENMILCVPMGENEFGRWLGFETLTRTYLDTSALDFSLMERREIDWLNNFNRMVFDEIGPYLNADEKKWLEKKTRPIECLK